MRDKIIKDQKGGYQRWEPPIVEGSQELERAEKQGLGSKLMTAEQLQRIQEQAHQEAFEGGFKQGVEEGLKAGQQELETRIQQLEQKAQQLDQLMSLLSKPFQQLDEQVEQELVTLTIAIGRQVIRRELKTEPGEILAVIREAVATLPVAVRNVRLLLHPEDLALVKDLMPVSDDNKHWQFVEDPTLSPGGCKVVTESSQIDASVENRIAAIATHILGGEREND
jgi:flagellar assembly protein FliH